MGLMTGAYTTSPGFASAKEAFHGSAEAVAMVAAGYGIILVFVPLTLGFALSRRVFRLPMLNGLAAMSGGMTCSPSLAALIQVAGTTDVASTYATTYPIALINMVIVMQILAKV